MADFAVPGDDPCTRMNPIYRESLISIIYPKDIEIDKLLKVINRCISDYVKANSKYGFNEPLYIDTCKDQEKDQ